MWYAFVLLFPAFLITVMSALYLALGYTLEWDVLPEPLVAYLPTLAFMAVLGGGNEEPGWRGFALPELMQSYTPFLATLILGVFWALWHAPLLLTNQEIMSGAMSLTAVATIVGVTMISITVHAFWYTWLYHRTGSVLLCILLHAGYNAANGLLVLVAADAAYQPLLVLMTLVLIASVVLLLIATRGRLGRRTDADQCGHGGSAYPFVR